MNQRVCRFSCDRLVYVGYMFGSAVVLVVDINIFRTVDFEIFVIMKGSAYSLSFGTVPSVQNELISFPDKYCRENYRLITSDILRTKHENFTHSPKYSTMETNVTHGN